MEAAQETVSQSKGSAKELELNHAIEPTIHAPSHGIENARNDSEMISIATSDAMEFGGTPLNGQAPLSPPVANSMAAAMADESSVSPIAATGGSPESSLGNFSQGAGASGVPLFNNLSGKISRTSEVTTILKTLSFEAENGNTPGNRKSTSSFLSVRPNQSKSGFKSGVMKSEAFLSRNPRNYVMLFRSLGVNSRKPVGSVDFDLEIPLFKIPPLITTHRPNKASNKDSPAINKRTQRLTLGITLADNNPCIPQRARRQATPFPFGLNFHYLP